MGGACNRDSRIWVSVLGTLGPKPWRYNAGIYEPVPLDFSSYGEYEGSYRPPLRTPRGASERLQLICPKPIDHAKQGPLGICYMAWLDLQQHPLMGRA